jgi:RimJ/RimL family protein N-acetyltransferase
MTGLGLEPNIIREFLRQFVFVNPVVRVIITDPEETNVRSLRAFKKAGFKAVNTVQLVGEASNRQIMCFDCP